MCDRTGMGFTGGSNTSQWIISGFSVLTFIPMFSFPCLLHHVAVMPSSSEAEQERREVAPFTC